jgi:hypothetical protein
MKDDTSYGILLRSDDIGLSRSLLGSLPKALERFYPESYAPRHMRLAYVDCRRYINQSSTTIGGGQKIAGDTASNPSNIMNRKKTWLPVDTDQLLLTLACQWITLECTMDEMANLVQDGSSTFQNGYELLKTAVSTKYVVMGNSDKDTDDSRTWMSPVRIRELFLHFQRHQSMSTALLVLLDHAELADCADLFHRLRTLGNDLSRSRPHLHYRFVLNLCKRHPRESTLTGIPYITSQTEIEGIKLCYHGKYHMLIIIECKKSLETPFLANREAQIMQAEPGTFNWLPQNDAFKHWSLEGGVLWIRGKPGSGKSTLAKHALEHIKAWYQQPDNSSLAKRALVTSWFYSTKMSTSNTSHHVMLRSLIHRIIEQDHGLFNSHKALYESLRKPAPTPWQWSTDDLIEFLKLISEDNNGPDVIGVIDALDESDDDAEDMSRDQFMRQLLTMTSKETSKLRLIILSRPYRPFQKAFQDCEQIYLERENNPDIERVVQSGLARLRSQVTPGLAHSDGEDTRIQTPKLRRRKRATITPRVSHPTLSILTQAQLEGVLTSEFAEMEKYLLANAKGVILWITLVFRELERIVQSLPNFQDLKTALFDLPPGLNEFYRLLTQRIQAQGVDKARKILMWTIGVTERGQLTLAMLFEAMKIPTEYDMEQLLASDIDPLFQQQLLFRDWESFALMVYDICGGFIDIIPTRGPVKPLREYEEDEFEGDWIVTLLHRTVQQFLADRDLSGDLQITAASSNSAISEGLSLYIQLYLPLVRTSFVPSPSILPIDGSNFDEPVRTFSTTGDSANACSSLFGDCDFVTYLDDKRLLPLALRWLPSQWNEISNTPLSQYRSIFQHEPTLGMHPWTHWIRMIPGRSFRVVVEDGLLNALEIIEHLVSLRGDTFSSRSPQHWPQRSMEREMLGAMMLITSDEGPSFMLPHLIIAYLSQPSEIYDLVRHCHNHGFYELAARITWGSWQSPLVDELTASDWFNEYGVYDRDEAQHQWIRRPPFKFFSSALEGVSPCVLRILRIMWNGSRNLDHATMKFFYEMALSRLLETRRTSYDRFSDSAATRSTSASAGSGRRGLRTFHTTYLVPHTFPFSTTSL